jgi:hypothetical protein
MTYVTDICLNETERRGELTISNGVPVVPYECEYGVETILTRADAIGRKAKVRLNRVEKMNKRKKYRVAKVYYKTDKGEDGVIHSDSNGKPRFNGSVGPSQKPNDKAKNSTGWAATSKK